MSKTPTRPKAGSREKTTADEWTASVSSHFQQTGTFRAVDILRVLGNPLQGVEVRASDYGSFSSKAGPR
jgi:hypothetical protein